MLLVYVTSVDKCLNDDGGVMSVHRGQHQRRSPEPVHCARIRRAR